MRLDQKSPASKASLAWLVMLVGAVSGPTCYADPEPVSVRVSDPKVWVGQRFTFNVEVRAPGTFAGATNFTIPQVPETVIIKLGRAVVSSEPIEGKSWNVQTHEFALFSQRDGKLLIPEFPVRFGVRDGATGPVTDRKENVPAFEVEVERPPGTDASQFIVTAESIDISENWQPEPGKPVKTGAVFKRTITQEVEGSSGMALAPAPTVAPSGVKVYTGQAEVDDKTERGAFSGKRIETVTYQIEQAGDHVLPEIRYTWWNPKTEKLESKTLPSITVSAIAPPVPPAERSPWRYLWWAVPVMVVLIVWSLRLRIAEIAGKLHDLMDPPEHRAARRFLHCCRDNDAEGASHAWSEWGRFHSDDELPAPLAEEIKRLRRQLYGPVPNQEEWRGRELAEEFDLWRKGRKPVAPAADLPPLNPG